MLSKAYSEWPGAADVLPTWCYTDRGGEVNARGVRPLVNKYGMRHITSCVSAGRTRRMVPSSVATILQRKTCDSLVTYQLE